MKFLYRLFIIVVSVLFGMGLVFYFYPDPKLPGDAVITHIMVYKNSRQMLVFQHQKLLKTYTISLGGNPVGKKEFEGDGKTPEGKYFIEDKNPKSDYYLNLGISYPDEDEKLQAKAKGKSAGGDIKIHGMKNGWGVIGKFHRLFDWTEGCIAVTNTEIEEIFYHTEIRTPIQILP